MPQKSLGRLFWSFASPPATIEESSDVSTQEYSKPQRNNNSSLMTAMAQEPIGSAMVTPCRGSSSTLEKMSFTHASSSSSTTVATAAITPMTPSPWKSPSCSEDSSLNSSLDETVSSQPGVAPTTAPVPSRRSSYDTGVTFRDLQQGFLGGSSHAHHHYPTAQCQTPVTPYDVDVPHVADSSKRRTLFPPEECSESSPPRTQSSGGGSSGSRRRPRPLEPCRSSVRSRATLPASVRRSRLQESLFLIDDRPPPMVGRASTINSFSRQPYPSPSYELSSHSSPESSPDGKHTVSSSTLRLLRRRASHASMLVIPPDDNDDSCFEDKKTSGSSRDFLQPKRGSFMVLWTFCMAAAMAACGMVAISKFVPFQQAERPEPSQGLTLYYPPLPQRRPDVHRSASGLRGKMVQSGASRITASTEDYSILPPLPPKDSKGTTRTRQVNGKFQSPSTTKRSSSGGTGGSSSVPKEAPSKKTNITLKNKKKQKVKNNKIIHDTEKKPPSVSSSGTKVSSTTAQTLLLQFGQPGVRSAFQMPEEGSLLISHEGWDDVDASLYAFGTSSSSSKKTTQRPSAIPRVIALDASWSGGVGEQRIVRQYPADFTDNTQLYSILDSDDERLSRMERREPLSDGECVPMQDWQTTFHPWCNGMHELSIEQSLGNDLKGEGNDIQLFGTKGYWRNAWRLDFEQGSSQHVDHDTVVLKTLKFEHNYEDDFFEHNRIDAVAMERLTSSPHVINVFGYCGHSVLTEFGDGSRVGELADKSRKKPMARLKIASDIANGLADVHGIDGDDVSSFVHLDINPANVVSIGGTLKLNDFNIGILRRWNTTSNTPCGFPAQYPNPQWRSPEEARNEQDLTEKVDIFSMGHIFFRLICGHEPWNKLEPGGRPSKEEINEKVQRGDLPFVPEDVRKSEDPEVIAIRNAMLKCYTFDPKERPSARKIAKELASALEALEATIASVTTASA